MKTKIKLNSGEELKFESSRSKGFMSETDINNYSVINKAGEKVGSIVHTDHTAVRGFKRTQTVLQKDIDGKTIIDEQW